MNISINGLEVVAEEGIAILEAAKRAEIHIPTLCQVKEGTSDIPCGLCVVEVEGRPNLAPSCCTPATEGMVVKISRILKC